MPWPAPFELSPLVPSTLAIACALVAYRKDPGMARAVVPQDKLSRNFGHRSALKAISIVAGARVVTPGGPMVSVLLPVAPATSGIPLAPLVVGLTSWSLFGLRRIIEAKAPFMGWGFVLIRTTTSFAFSVLAGCLVQLSFPE